MAAAWLLTLWLCAALGQEFSEQTLGRDDECLSRGDCAANALQLKGAAVAAGAGEDAEVDGGDAVYSGSDEDSDLDASGNSTGRHCEDCMMNNGPGIEEAVLGSSVRIWHYAQNCWYHCGRKSGSCPGYCGPGNACCRYRFGGPPECRHVGWWPSLAYHTCVMGSAPVPEITSSATTEDDSALRMQAKPPSFYYPHVLSLKSPSQAPLLTFYVYRAMSPDSYPMENVNAASAGGVMWYLHNEVVIFTPRKFKITRIVRFKVQYRPPTPFYDKGMSFGVRYAFDSGECTGPGNCAKDYDKYGYFVGCNKVFEYPTTQFADSKYYPNAVWYSFPGPCFTKSYKKHDNWCVQHQPGGACSGEPTGQGDCTYTYEPKGFVTVDEVVGLTDYFGFVRGGGKEYVAGLGYGQGTCRSMPWTCDKGIHMSFWNGKHIPQNNERRVQALLDAFAKKYPDEPSLDDVPCDFNQWHFYH